MDCATLCPATHCHFEATCIQGTEDEVTFLQESCTRSYAKHILYHSILLSKTRLVEFRFYNTLASNSGLQSIVTKQHRTVQQGIAQILQICSQYGLLIFLEKRAGKICELRNYIWHVL